MIKTILLTVLPSLLAPVAQGPTHSLLLRTHVGDSFSYEMRSVAVLGGSEGVLTSHYAMTVASLEPKGTATFKTAQIGGKFVMGGKESAIPESVVTAKMKLNGVMQSVDPPSATPDQARVARIMQYVVPEVNVGVGHEWTWQDPASPLNGNVPAEGRGKVVSFAEHGGMSCARLQMTLKETEGSAPAAATFDVWISLEDGMMVESTTAVENAPLGPGVTAKMDVSVKRVVK